MTGNIKELLGACRAAITKAESTLSMMGLPGLASLDRAKVYIAAAIAEQKLVSEELEITNKLLAERERVLRAVPECPAHGSDCVPHALEWVEKAKAAMAAQDEVQPLTDEQIMEEWFYVCDIDTNSVRKAVLFARAIERAHGICQLAGKGGAE